MIVAAQRSMSPAHEAATGRARKSLLQGNTPARPAQAERPPWPGFPSLPRMRG